MFTEDEEMMTMDGFDDCIVGTVEQFGRPTIVCYDRQKVLEQLVTESGMDEDEALEWYYFNMVGAGMGDSTPCFLEIPDPE